MDAAVDRIGEVLSQHTIHLDKLGDDTCIFGHVDVFVNLSRENETVHEVDLWIPATDPDDDASGTHDRYAIWDKIAEGIRNLQALRQITISYDHSMDEWEVLVPDWEILACILRRLQRGIKLRMKDDDDCPLLWNTETLPFFAGVIHGQAMIKGFCTGNGFHFDCLDILCSALLTLPALENVQFQHYVDQGPEEGQSLESMVKLLQSPALQEVDFTSIAFTNKLSQAVAEALRERSGITNLSFLGCCYFPEGGLAVIARALTTNTTLKHLKFDVGGDEVFYKVLAAALLSNSSLQDLECIAPDGSGSCSWLSPLFLALEVNVGLKKLCIPGIDLIDEKLSTAMRIGLGKNSTLEKLNLWDITAHNDTSLWREAFSFLRTNTALKVLNMDFKQNVMESYASAIRMEVLATLCENESLDTLSIMSPDAALKNYLKCVVALQSNRTLKKLQLHEDNFSVDKVEFKDLIPALKKNYGLEETTDFHYRGAGDIRSILQLNRAGRRYLVQDGSSISKGVDVLSRVNNVINSVFLHLLENPRLCDRSAVEMSSIGNIDNDMATSPGDHSGGSGGKREHEAPSRMGIETRRRLE
jgi:hypothetical protein